MTTLMLHRGARHVEVGELNSIAAPPPTESWFPLSHGTVFRRVSETLVASGYEISKQQLALSADNHKFFGTLDLTAQVADGISLMIGIRNSTDQTHPIGFAAGERIWVCDNGAFSSEVVIARRHTRNGERRFNDALSRAVLGLRQYEGLAAARIEKMQQLAISANTANSLLLQACEQVVGWRLLPKILEEYRHPSHKVFEEKTLWSLFNAFTEVLKERQRTQPARAAAETIRLQQLLLKQGEVIDVQFTKQPAVNAV